jgi:NAD(P) transhydrogenase subunit alpha
MINKTAFSTGFPGQALLLLVAMLLLLFAGFGQPAGADDEATEPAVTSENQEDTTVPVTSEEPVQDEKVGSGSRNQAMIASLTIFVLAIFIGFEIITKVPPTLHTPLMSGSNAISGITLVGAVLVAGHSEGIAPLLGMVAVSLATVNVIGGFLVTHRMLSMFVKRK